MSYSRARAILTRHKGYNFRSRLEARYSIFFDHLGVKWEYEPEGFELGNGLRYLPDFWLPEWDMWVEIKPDEADDVTREKARRLLETTGKPVYVTAGMPDRNGVLFYLDESYCPVEVPAFAYFQADTPLVLCFGETHEYPEHRCEKIRLHNTKFNAERAEAGAHIRGDVEAAFFAARGARFEFGAKGAV